MEEPEFIVYSSVRFVPKTESCQLASAGSYEKRMFRMPQSPLSSNPSGIDLVAVDAQERLRPPEVALVVVVEACDQLPPLPEARRVLEADRVALFRRMLEIGVGRERQMAAYVPGAISVYAVSRNAETDIDRDALDRQDRELELGAFAFASPTFVMTVVGICTPVTGS